MKKIVFLSLFALCLPWTLVAQSIDDDLYYTPSKNKEEKKEEVKQEKKVAAPVEEIVVKSNVPTTVYSSPGSTTVVVKDRKGNTRDVDEYNRRYDSRDNDFVMENDTLYINEKEDDGLDGEWVRRMITSMLPVSSVSVIPVMPSASAARYIGMWSMA